MVFKKWLWLIRCCLLAVAFLFFYPTHAVPSHFNYQGRLFDTDGQSLDSGTITMKLQIMDPSGNCLLREETHNVSMVNSGGFFSVTVGFGSPTSGNPSTLVFSEIFSNATTFSDPNVGCNGGSYTPSAGDSRILRVTIDDEVLSPDQVISSVPNAFQADRLGGKSLNEIEDYSDKNWAGAPLPDLQASPLVAGDSFKWDGSKWVIFQPGSATGLTDVVAGAGLTETGTTTKTVDIGAGDGITVGADSITLNLGSGLQFNSGAVEIDQSAISYSNLSGLPSLPSQLSDLTGDSDSITQGSTNLFMTGSERTKLSGVAANAEVNVQSDWNAGSGDAQILNKPSIPSNITDLTVGADSISGNAIDGGVISNFASAGIDDNAATNAVTIDSSGNVGVGTASPGLKLVVNGAAANASSKSNGTSTIDFSTGNLQYTASSCQSFNLHNLKDGGSFTFAIQGGSIATCSFNAYSDAGSTSLTVHLPSDHGATISGKHTLYTFLVMGTHVYVSWNPGL